MQIQNQTWLAVMALILVLPASAVTHYVDPGSANATPPYTGWASAATNIQDAVDVASAGDLVLVTNGTYGTGGRLVAGDKTTSRVVVPEGVTLQSVNGPAVTVIEGYQMPGAIYGTNAVRCVYMANGATLVGFTLTGGATDSQTGYGGGLYFQTLMPTTSWVSNCVVAGNSARVGGGGVFGGGELINCTLKNNHAFSYGGGAYGSVLVACTLSGNSAGQGGGSIQCLLTNCLVVGNTARNPGGGSYGDKLFNCTVVSNSAPAGGGIGNSLRAANCIVYYNNAPIGSNYWDSTMVNCCTTPLPNDSGNFTNAPLFVDLVGGDFHLQSSSPCINSGKNSYLTIPTDLDGAPRLRGGTVDVGAYEFPSPTSVLPYAWAQRFGLPTDGSADFADPDHDGADNWQESQAGTDPAEPLSYFHLLSVTDGAPGLQIQWQGVSGKTYYVQRASDLTVPPVFLTVKSFIAGKAGTMTYNDTSATTGGPYFYRVGIQ